MVKKQKSCQTAKAKLHFKKRPKNRPSKLLPHFTTPHLIRCYWKDYSLSNTIIFEKNKILYRFQPGFWKNYSTNTCLGHLIDKITIYQIWKRSFVTRMILIYLQRVFDTIDNQILIKKMNKENNWCKSYLSEQKLEININTSFSSPSNLICGIPQGSILGQLLFLLYILMILA